MSGEFSHGGSSSSGSGGAPSGSAGGDLSGTYPNPTVAKLNGVAAASYALASSVTTETSRAETAEALLAPLASPTFTGTVVVPAGTITNAMLAGSITAAKISASLDQFAAPAADVAWGSHGITGLRDPVAAQEPATQNYVGLAGIVAARYTAISGISSESMPWYNVVSTMSTGSAGTLNGVLIPVTPGQVIGALTVSPGTTGWVWGTNNDGHWWVALYDIAWANRLALSADQGHAGLAASTAYKVAMTSPYTVPAGVHALFGAFVANPGTGGSPTTGNLRSSGTIAAPQNAIFITGASMPTFTADTGITSGGPPSTPAARTATTQGMWMVATPS